MLNAKDLCKINSFLLLLQSRPLGCSATTYSSSGNDIDDDDIEHSNELDSLRNEQRRRREEPNMSFWGNKSSLARCFELTSESLSLFRSFTATQWALLAREGKTISWNFHEIFTSKAFEVSRALKGGKEGEKRLNFQKGLLVGGFWILCCCSVTSHRIFYLCYRFAKRRRKKLVWKFNTQQHPKQNGKLFFRVSLLSDRKESRWDDKINN